MSSATTVNELLERGQDNNYFCDLVLRSPVESWRPWYRAKLIHLQRGAIRLSSSCYVDTPTIIIDFARLTVCECIEHDGCECYDIIANVEHEVLEGLRNDNIALYNKLRADPTLPHDVRGAGNDTAVQVCGFIM